MQEETLGQKNDDVRNRSGNNTLVFDLGQTWLAWQCRMVAGIIRGALFHATRDGRTDAVVSIWPGGGEGQDQMQDVASQVVKGGRGIIRSQQKYGPGNHRTCDLIACPLSVGGKLVAVVTVMVSTRSEPQQHAVMQLLQWGGLWLETLIQQHNETQKEVGLFTLALMTDILGQSDSHLAIIEVVNRLADRFDCERVSMGFRNGLSIRLETLSRVANFDPRTQLVRRIEAAMEEAVDQATILVHPAQSSQPPFITRAHSELSEQQGHGSICTIPLPGRSATIGAITLERGDQKPFDKDTLALCESLAKLIGPALDMKRREERPIWSKAGEAFVGLAAKLFGPSRFKPMLTLLSITLVLVTLSLVDGAYRITAPASIEGGFRQLLVAPQDGYVRQAEVRAGDLVHEGQLIATLDDSDLKLELLKWQSQRNKVEKEYQDALAKRDRTSLSVSRAQLEQMDAEIRLVEEMIERTEMLAPFDGVVLSGDLSQSLGSPVETGQVLFEVAPLDSYRVLLEVDEHDVADLRQGKSGQLIIAALPNKVFNISLGKVTPVAISGEGRNYFKVEASMDMPSNILRPGMQGVAKVDIGQRKLLWIWTHAVIDRVRLWIWSIGL